MNRYYFFDRNISELYQLVGEDIITQLKQQYLETFRTNVREQLKDTNDE